jgi:hypothetical protein
MEGAIVLVVIVVLGLLITEFQKNIEASIPEKSVEVKESVCPPHRWRFIEQPGMENTYYIKCDECNKMPGQLGEEATD